jgi:hypothetical protein
MMVTQTIACGWQAQFLFFVLRLITQKDMFWAGFTVRKFSEKNFSMFLIEFEKKNFFFLIMYLVADTEM